MSTAPPKPTSQPPNNWSLTKGRIIALSIIGGLFLLGIVTVVTRRALAPIPVSDSGLVVFDKKEVTMNLYEALDIKPKIVAGTKFSWSVPDPFPLGTFRAGIDPQGQAIGTVFAQHPGSYSVCIGYETNAGIVYVFCKVIVTNPNLPPITPPPVIPPPVVNPPPNPPPPVIPPTVMPTSMFLIAVDDPKASQKWIPDFLANDGLNKRMSDFKHQWQIVDKFGNDERGKPFPELGVYVKKASTKALPYVFIVDRQNNALKWEGVLPVKSPSDFLAKLIEAGG